MPESKNRESNPRQLKKKTTSIFLEPIEEEYQQNLDKNKQDASGKYEKPVFEITYQDGPQFEDQIEILTPPVSNN